MGWLAISLVIGVGLYKIVSVKSVRYSPLLLKLTLCCVLLLIPYFYQLSNIDVTFDRMLGLFAGLTFLLVLQQFQFSANQRLTLLLLIIASVWIEVVIGWGQYFDALYPKTLFGVVIRNRVAGVFQQVNVLASFLAGGLVLSGYVLSLKHKHGFRFQVYQVPVILLPLAIIPLLVDINSRSGWLGATLGSFLVLPYLWRETGIKPTCAWFSMILAGFVLSWGIGLTTESGSAIVTSSAKKELFSLQGERTRSIPQTLDMILERPFAGYGYGNFESAYLNYTAERHALDSNYEEGMPSLDHPHNELLFWSVEGGAIALMSLLLAAYFVWQRLMRKELFHRLALIGIFFPIVLHSQVEYPFYVSISHWIVFILLIFWADNISPEYKEKRLASTLLIGTAGVVIPVITVLFMVTTLQTGLLLAKFESHQMENIEDFQELLNPLVFQDRIQWTINSKLVVNALATGQPELAQYYIDWASEFVERVPRTNFFSYLILAYQIVGDEENAKLVQQKASYLFPNRSFKLEDIGKMIVRPVNSSEVNSLP